MARRRRRRGKGKGGRKPGGGGDGGVVEQVSVVGEVEKMEVNSVIPDAAAVEDLCAIVAKVSDPEDCGSSQSSMTSVVNSTASTVVDSDDDCGGMMGFLAEEGIAGGNGGEGTVPMDSTVVNQQEDCVSSCDEVEALSSPQLPGASSLHFPDDVTISPPPPISKNNVTAVDEFSGSCKAPATEAEAIIFELGNGSGGHAAEGSVKLILEDKVMENDSVSPPTPSLIPVPKLDDILANLKSSFSSSTFSSIRKKDAVTFVDMLGSAFKSYSLAKAWSDNDRLNGTKRFLEFIEMLEQGTCIDLEQRKTSIHARYDFRDLKLILEVCEEYFSLTKRYLQIEVGSGRP